MLSHSISRIQSSADLMLSIISNALPPSGFIRKNKCLINLPVKDIRSSNSAGIDGPFFTGIGDVLTTHLNSLISVTFSLWFLYAAERIDPQQTYLHKSFKRNTCMCSTQFRYYHNIIMRIIRYAQDSKITSGLCLASF